jgi:hypothetical protein
MTNFVDIISCVIGTAFPSMIIYYLYSLKQLGCQCSLTAKRNYILGFNSFLIAYSLFTIGMGGANGVVSLYIKYPWLCLIFFLLVIGSVINVAFTIEFVNDMKREKCACSDSVFKDIMYILSIIQAVTWSILGLIILVMGGLLTKDIATGKITMKNVERFQKLYKNGFNNAFKK